jgi:hypothetical protein
MNSFIPRVCASYALATRHQRRGFSVIETVIACTLIMIVMAGSYLILDTSMNLVRTARDGYTTATISNARLERARMAAYSDLPTMAESNTVIDEYGLPTTLGRLRRTTTVSTNQPLAGCTTVVVTTEAHKPGAASSVYYNARSMTGVFTPLDTPP